MALAIVVGVVMGVVAFAPLGATLQLSKRVTSTSNLSNASVLLLGAFVSVLVLAASLILCVLFARDIALPFTFAVAASLVLSAVCFAVYTALRK
jgi:hypothetical protein